MKSFLINLSNAKDIGNLIKKDNKKLCICLGNFDGVHIAHQQLIKEAILNSEFPVSVMSFSRPLGSFNIGNKSSEVLMSETQKQIFFRKLGLDYFFNMELNEEMINLSAENFIKSILMSLNIEEVYIGEDFCFGKGALGDYKLLEKYFKVNRVKLIKNNDEKISTSSIIKMVKNGDLKDANYLLGREYEIVGKVAKGFQIGRTINLPTLNLDLNDEYVLPKFGVYKVLCYLSGIPYIGLANVGIHPTINKLEKPIVEVHLLDYDGDAYGKTVYINFIKKIRDEMKFSSLEELKEQIKLDLKTIKEDD